MFDHVKATQVKAKHFFVIVNSNLGKVWSGGHIRGVPKLRKYDQVHKIPPDELCQLVDGSWGWRDDTGESGQEYETIGGAHKCPAWKVFKCIPHIYIEERVFELKSVKVHDFSSVVVAR